MCFQKGQSLAWRQQSTLMKTPVQMLCLLTLRVRVSCRTGSVCQQQQQIPPCPNQLMRHFVSRGSVVISFVVHGEQTWAHIHDEQIWLELLGWLSKKGFLSVIRASAQSTGLGYSLSFVVQYLQTLSFQLLWRWNFLQTLRRHRHPLHTLPQLSLIHI